jgi:hypothetical protein
LQCEFDEITYKLNISLTICKRDYKADISVPPGGYAKDLFDKYNFLKSIAVAYWSQFREDNKALFERICNYRKDIDWTELIIDPKSPTTLYFDPNSDVRIGIFPYYVDENGRALRRR